MDLGTSRTNPSINPMIISLTTYSQLSIYPIGTLYYHYKYVCVEDLHSGMIDIARLNVAEWMVSSHKEQHGTN